MLRDIQNPKSLHICHARLIQEASEASFIPILLTGPYLFWGIGDSGQPRDLLSTTPYRPAEQQILPQPLILGLAFTDSKMEIWDLSE